MAKKKKKSAVKARSTPKVKPRPKAKPKARPTASKPATVKLAAAKVRLATHPKKALIKAKVESRAQARGVAPGLATALITKPVVQASPMSAPSPSYAPATEEMEPEVDEQSESEEVQETETEEEQTTPDDSDESDSDVELGFVGAVAAAAPAALKAVGKIGKVFKKKKKKKKVTQMPVMNITGSVPSKSAVVQATKEAIAGIPTSDTQSLVNAVVAAVPGPVRDVVLEALKAQAQTGIAKEATMEAIAGQVDESLKPQIAAMLAALQARQLQDQATYEHESLVADATFRNTVTSGLGTALSKLEALEKRLGSSAIVPGPRIAVFGSRNILEGR